MLASLERRWPWQSNGVRSAVIDPRHQRADVVVASDVTLHDGEFIAAETGDEIIGPDRLAQPLRDALEEFVADQMAQRIVDALEFVDVDIEDRELHARGFEQQPLRVTLEQRPVRQIGQRVVMGEMLDPGLDAPPLGHVLQRGGPAAIRRALVDQPDRASVRRRRLGVADAVVLRDREISRNRRRRRRRTCPAPGDAGSDRADGSPGLTTSGETPNMSIYC